MRAINDANWQRHRGYYYDEFADADQLMRSSPPGSLERREAEMRLRDLTEGLPR